MLKQCKGYRRRFSQPWFLKSQTHTKHLCCSATAQTFSWKKCRPKAVRRMESCIQWITYPSHWSTSGRTSRYLTRNCSLLWPPQRIWNTTSKETATDLRWLFTHIILTVKASWPQINWPNFRLGWQSNKAFLTLSSNSNQDSSLPNQIHYHSGQTLPQQRRTNPALQKQSSSIMSHPRPLLRYLPMIPFWGQHSQTECRQTLVSRRHPQYHHPYGLQDAVNLYQERPWDFVL